jgi:hypothetical protein
MAPIGWRVRRLLHDQISTTKVSPLTPPISPRHRQQQQQQQQQQQPTMTIMMTTRGLPNSTTTAAAAAAMFAASRTVAMTTMGVVTTTLPPSTHGGDNRQRIANRISVMAVGASLCFLCHVGLQLTWGNMFTRQASQRCMSLLPQRFVVIESVIIDHRILFLLIYLFIYFFFSFFLFLFWFVLI